MNLCMSMILRPSSFILLLGYAAMIVLIALTPCWYVTITRLEHLMNLNVQNVFSQFQTEMKHSSKLIQPMHSSSSNLARLLSSTLKDNNTSFDDIKTKVAPSLFQAFETVPYLAQISYIGMDGLFFSYYTDYNQSLAMYSNSSFSTNSVASNTTLYYVQPINRDTGELYGEAITSKPSFNNTSYGYNNVSLGTKWSNNGHDLMFISSARITRTSVISIGFPAKAISDFFTSVIGPHGASLYLATKDGQVLVEGNIQHTHMVISNNNDTVSFHSVDTNDDDQITSTHEGTVSCKDGDVASSLNIQDIKYLIHCSTIDIMGIESVYVLAFPQNGLASFVHNSKKNGLTLLIVMIVMMIIAIVSFLYINARASRREMHLCSSLIKQMETTQQAERKSMNKSHAVAKASHDVRASLLCLNGLIGMCYQKVVTGSELETNLEQMKSCTEDLLGLLNSILDTSKIEAGQMQLEEEEFDLFQLLEDEVDFYHLAAMTKGVDLVLDPCDGSVLRYSHIEGDKKKLKQVLSNLLSNAVKFTDEGHIAVRIWAQKPSLQNSIINNNRCSKLMDSCLFYKKNEACDDDLGAMNSIQQDPKCMDFVFEVDDTGKGIPKEKYKSVFENYVQVKETALGQGGTGLGLGIVQSLVRLMHGDIRIMDKDIGEKGTCFKFNVLLRVCETGLASSTREGQFGSGDRNQAQGSRSSICSLSPKLRNRSPNLRPESQIVLLIRDEERRRITQRFMERLGIKVKVVKPGKHLRNTLMKIKQKGCLSSPGSSSLSSPSASHNSTAKAKGVSSMDGSDHIITIFNKIDVEATSGFILIVIDAEVDADAGPFSELFGIVSDFKRGLGNPCKVVWLVKPHMCRDNFKAFGEDVFDSNDIVLSKPFHGSRLFEVIKLLPEYGGAWQCSTSRAKRKSMLQVSPTHDEREIQKYDNSRSLKENQQPFGDQSHDRSKARKSPFHQGEMQECGDSSTDKPLNGYKFLVVDDSKLSCRIAEATLKELGASVEQCENGEQAVQLVGEGLTRRNPNPPYDYILMDCQMRVMDGCEATRLIREMEKPYGVHIPIIALTAHTREEAKEAIEAGMDGHLSKPINQSRKTLLTVIRNLHRKE